MSETEFALLTRKGITAAERGEIMIAMVHFQDAAKLKKTPLLCSYLGYCLGRERRRLPQAVALCKQALQGDPGNPVHYLNLGRVYDLAGEKGLAIKAFRQGLKFGRSPQIVAELKKMGLRREPLLSGLHRDHPFNKYLGVLLSKLGMR